MKKYSLTSNTMTWLGTTLYQIKAEVSFGIVANGELGGYIEKEENVSQEGNAWVSGDARVSGNARVSGDARVYGNAQVSGDAWVSGNAQVSGDARIYGDAWVSGDARVSGNAQVSGNARVSAKASFTKGWFIVGDDTGKIKDITKETGSTIWKHQYVLGDYEITPITEDEKKEVPVKEVQKSVIIDGVEYVPKN